MIMALGDRLSDTALSFVLLIAAGNFIFIALTELLPGALECHTGKHDKGRRLRRQGVKLVLFVGGCLILGIPLSFDQHCESGGDGTHSH